MKNLIVYFSRAGENYCNGAIKVIQKGNTAVAAEFIRDAVGGDMFEIKTKKIYSDNYYKCIEQTKAEMQNGERPELQTYPGSVDGYDTVFLCYPNWFGHHAHGGVRLYGAIRLVGQDNRRAMHKRRQRNGCVRERACVGV